MKLGALNYSKADGQGYIGLPASFHDADPLFRKDMLKDWIYDLTVLYESFDIWGNPLPRRKK